MDPMSSVEDTKLHQSTSEIPQKVVSRFGFLQLSERSSATAETQSQQTKANLWTPSQAVPQGLPAPCPLKRYGLVIPGRLSSVRMPGYTLVPEISQPSVFKAPRL